MEQVLMSAKGANGTLELTPDRIRIRRDGLVKPFYGRNTLSELLLSQITSIEMDSTAGGLAWYISFHDAAQQEAVDDLCLSFFKPQLPRFEAIKQAIEERRAAVLQRLSESAMGIFHYDGMTSASSQPNYVSPWER